MDSTQSERDAARHLSEALLRFLRATEEGVAQRRSARQPDPPSGEGVPRRLFTQKEAGQYLAVSEKTVFNLSEPRGMIPVVRIGASKRYAIEDLDEAVRRLRSKHR